MAIFRPPVSGLPETWLARPSLAARAPVLALNSWAASWAWGATEQFGEILATTFLRSLADSDGNGLPDDWELAYFGELGINGREDPDQDGVSNRSEFLAGTLPTSASSVLRISEFQKADASTFRLSFPSLLGFYYQIEGTPMLDGKFEVVGPVLLGTGLPLETMIREETEANFYRVRRVLLP